MSKTPIVRHSSWRIVEGAPACDVYVPIDDGLRDAGEQEGVFIISGGLGSIKSDYGRFARQLACKGFTVVTPNCNEPHPSSTAVGALDRRAESLVRTMEAWGADKYRLITHSLGAVAAVKAMEQSGTYESGEIISVSHMQPAAFDKHGWRDIPRAFKLLSREAVPRTARLLPALLQNPRSTYERLNLRERVREVRELWDMDEDFMTRNLAIAQASGIVQHIYVGPKDNIVRPEPVRRAAEPIIGRRNVIDIHPDAGHLTAQSHPRRMARLILDELPSVVDANSMLGRAA